MVVKPAQDKPQTAAKPDKPPPQDKIILGPGAVSGNLTYDPELRFTPMGRAVSKLGIAVSDRRQNPETGQWEDGPVEFYTITAWGQLAENCAEHLRKGDRIVAEGTWEERKWINKEGEVRSFTEMTARDLGPSLVFRGARVIRPERAKS